MTRVQWAVLLFVGTAVLALIALLATGSQAVQMPFEGGANLVFLLGLLILLSLVAVGTIRRWRWMFWLIVVAFGVGGLARIPTSALQVTAVIPASGPAWYEVLQGLIGIVQVAIAGLMLRGWRRGGAWHD